MSKNLFQVRGASKSFGPKILFQDIALAVNEGEHIGLIGPNGAGKTTLFRCLAGKDEFDLGEIVRSRGLSMAYLEQEADWPAGLTVAQILEAENGLPLWQLKKMGQQLGLSDLFFERLFESLSGGYRMRVKLLALLAHEPQLLLLDEPTNFLDLETVLVLERFLQGFEGAFLLISHDREFLKRVTDHIVEVEAGDVTKYPGHLDDYFEQKALIREQLEKTAASQAAKRQIVLDFAARFGAKASKARQAQSRMKSLEKMEQVEVKPLPVRARIQLPAPVRTGKELLQLRRLDCGYGTHPVLQKIDFILQRGDRLGIVGINGAGKSTLLKTLAGTLPQVGGEISWGMGAVTALFSQHSADQLEKEHSVLQALESAAHPEVLRQEILNMAGSLLFSGADIEKKIKVLSGGEKARIALGQVLLKKASLLLLDEPTNHLDFETVEALTIALANYEGSIMVVSHDRGFIRRISSKILEIESGRMRLYPGNYDDYLWSMSQGMLAEEGRLEDVEKKTLAKDMPEPLVKTPGNQREQRRRLESELRHFEKELLSLDKKLLKLRDEQIALAKSCEGQTGMALANASIALHDLTEEINRLEEQALSLMETQDNHQRQLAVIKGS